MMNATEGRAPRVSVCGADRAGRRLSAHAALFVSALLVVQGPWSVVDAPSVSADTTYRWDFTNAVQYNVSDATSVAVEDGKAHLTLLQQIMFQTTRDMYRTNTSAISLAHLGPQASVGLTKSGGFFQQGGIYWSQVFDRGIVNNKWQALLTRVANSDLAALNVMTEVPSLLNGISGLWHLNNSTVDAVTGLSGSTFGASFVPTAKFGTHAGSYNNETYMVSPATLPSLTSFSVSFWVRAAQTAQRTIEIPLQFNDGGSARLAVWVGGSYTHPLAHGFQLTAIGLINSQTGWRDGTTSGAFTAMDVGQWRHIVVTYDGNPGGLTTIYKDAQSLPMYSNELEGALPSATELRIGSPVTSGLYFNGLVDEIAMFTRVLSADEVRNLFLLQRPVKFRVRSGAALPLSSQFIGYDGSSNTYFVAETTVIPTNGAFNVEDPYVQYEVRLDPSTDRLLSPYVQSVAFLGDKGVWFDYSQDDFLLGTCQTNTVVYPSRRQWWYIGLSKLANGGYEKLGEYISRPLDAGEPVIWDSLSWDIVSTELASTLSGLLGLWHMNGNWADASSAGHAGSAQNVTYTPMAKLGTGSAVFNGVDASVSLGSIGSVASIEFWIRDSNMNDGLFSFAGGSTPYVVIANGYVQPVGFPSGTLVYVNSSISSSKLVAGWNHVAIVMPSGVSATGFSVGYAGGDYMEGTLDEMAAYNRQLTSAEISEHFEGGRPVVAGRIRLQARSGTSVDNLLSKPFTGPGYATNTYYSDSERSVLVAGDEQFLQYRILMEGDGNSTPAIGTVTVTHSLKTLPPFVEDAPTELIQGSFVDGKVRLYGDEISPIKLAAAGPFNINGSSDASLRGLWHLDETSWPPGASVRDSSSNSRHGSPGGNAKPTFGARTGVSCGSFDGSGAYVSLQAVDDIGSGSFTVALWFKTTAMARSALISSYDGIRYYTLEVNGDGTNQAVGRVTFIVSDNGVTGPKAVMSVRGSLNDDRWHHVAGVRDGNYIHIYVDGDRVGTTSLGSYGNVAASSVLTLAKYGTLNLFYQGYLDEAVIYKRALSDGEVGELAAAGYQVTGQATFTGPTLDAGQPVVWGQLKWGAHGPAGDALSGSDTSLVGLWHLDETNGPIRDASASGLDGTFNGAGYAAAGRLSSALSFNGTSDRVEVPDSDLLEPPLFTVEAWIYPTGSGQMTIVGKRDGSAGYELRLDVDGKAEFWLSGTSCASLLPLRQNGWSHVLGIYDGTRIWLCINGEPAASAVPVGVVIGTGNPLRIGMSHAGAGVVRGRVDEVAIHNRVLLGEEVLDHYRAGATVLRFQGRTGDALPLTGSFIGPGGRTDTYFTSPLGSLLRGSIPTARYFQYKGYLDTEDSKYPPILRGVSVDVLSYSTLNPWVEPVPAMAMDFPGDLLQFNDQRTYDSNATTAVRYQITGDAGSSSVWYYWNTSDSRWTAVDPFGPSEYPFQTSTRDEVNANFSTFFWTKYAKTGGSFRFKAFMHSLGDQPVEIDWVEARRSDGRIVLTSPDGIEINENAWLTGVPYPVTWSYGGNVAGTVIVEYALLDAPDPTWKTIADNVPSTQGVVTWVTPQRESSRALVRIRHKQDTTIRDQSDGEFHLIQRFRVDVPNGAETWYMGETNRIYWDAPHNVSTVDIAYSPDDTWTNPVSIATYVTSQAGTRSNSYQWVISTSQPRFPSTTGKVRVQSTGVIKYADASDAFFTIAGAAFEAPSAGESVRQGQSFDLVWRSAGCGPVMKLEVNSTGTWDLVDAAVPNTDGALNTYAWTVAARPAIGARLRLTSLSTPRAMALSDPFVIAAIEVTRPRGAFDPAFTDVWPVGSTQRVQWVTAGASAFVNIYYSIDGGTTWNTNNPIAVGRPNVDGGSNSINWVVTGLPTDKALIRVEDALRPTELWDRSDYYFNFAGVTMLWPNGPISQEWVMGVSNRVTWQANAVGQDGRLEFSYDGTVFTNLSPVTGLVGMGDGSGPLFAPRFPTVQGMVRITPTDPLYSHMGDSADSFFTVAGVLVEKPAANDKYTIGGSGPITFVVAGAHDGNNDADIYYAGDGTTFLTNSPIKLNEVFDEGWPGRKSYTWNVEAIREPSTRARVKVVAGNYQAVSAPFTVRGIRFTAPAIGQLWGAGAKTIEWDVAGVADDAVGALYLSVDNGPYLANMLTGSVKVNTGLGRGDVPWTIPVDVEPSTNAVLVLVVTNSVTTPSDIGFIGRSGRFTLQNIRVTAPALNDTWDLGSTQTVVWKAAAGGSAVSLYYSSDGGTNYDVTPLELDVASRDGLNTYTWNIGRSRLPSSDARVKAVGSSGLIDESDRFTLRGLKFIRPRSTDILATTDPTNTLRWASAGIAGPYRLEYIKGGVTNLISAAVAGTSFNWAPIPPQAVGSNVMVRVSAGAYADISDPFRIVNQATVFITAPAAGAFWRVGQPYTIRWSRGGQMTDEFTASLSIAPYTATNLLPGIATYNAAENAYELPWTVTNRLGQARIIVQHNTLSSVRDVSREFNMVGSFTVWNPNGTAGRGQKLYALRPTPVTWRTIGSVPLVNAYYSTNSPYYPASSWVKVTDTPEPNSYKTDLTEEPTTWTWTVPNLRSSKVRFRVQEAAYTNRFDAGADGPYDDSDVSFTVDYYGIYWNVYDAATTGKLDKLSVTDSSGWSAGGLSCQTAPILREYPWGTWDTVWMREYFSDKVVLQWSAENKAIGAPAVWTQQVSMVKSAVEPDYRVMANFSYEITNQTFTVHTWLERGGQVLSGATQSRVFIYDSAGTLFDTLVKSPAQANGVFWHLWDASAINRRSVYFAKVEIEFSGVVYSSGLTFTIQVPVGEDAVLQIVSSAESNILASVSGVSNIVSDIQGTLNAFRSEAGTALTNLVGMGRVTTNLVTRMNLGFDRMTNAVVPGIRYLTNQAAMWGPLLTNIAAQVAGFDDQLSTEMARIITRPTSVPYGSQLSILYKTRSGYASNVVTIQVYNASSVPPPVYQDGMSEVLSGIYQDELVADWGTNTYVVTCSDPGGGVDSMILNVVSEKDPLLGSMTNMAEVLAVMSNQLAAVEGGVSLMTNINWSAVTNMASDLKVVTNQLGQIDFAAITNALGQMDWNDVVALRTNVDQLAQDVAALRLSFGGVDWSSLSNISTDVGVITNALGQMDWNDILALTAAMGTVTQDVATMRSQFAAVNWGSLSNISTDVAVITNALGQMDWNDILALTAAMGTMTQRVDTLTDLFGTVNWGSLSNISSDVGIITNALGQMDWNDILALTAAMNSVTQRVGVISDLFGTVNWSSLSNISSDVGVITNALGQMDWNDILALTAAMNGVTQRVDTIATLFAGVNWGSLSNISTDVGVITNALGQMDWNDVLALTAAMGTVTQDVSAMRSAFLGVNWGSLSNISTDVGVITNALGQMDWNDILSLQAAMGQVTQRVDSIAGLFASVNWGALSNISTDVGVITNALGQMDWNDILALTAAMGQVTQRVDTISALFASVNWSSLSNISTDVGVITNALGQMDWNDILALTAAMGGVTQRVDSIATLFASVNWGSLSNISTDVGVITNALGQMDWNDILALTAAMGNVTQRVDGISTLFASVDWGALSNISTDVGVITNALGQMDWNDILALTAAMGNVTQRVDGISALFASVDWGALSNISTDVGVITNALGQMDWNDILALTAAMGSVTQRVDTIATLFGGVNWGSLSNISTDVGVITNALGQMDWNDILALTAAMGGVTQRVDGIATLFAGVNWGSLSNISTDVAVITNALGQMNWNDILAMTAAMNGVTQRVETIATLFGGVNWGSLSNISTDVGTITNALGQMDWADILALSSAMNTVTQTVSGMSATFASVNWGSLSNMSSDVAVITNALGQMNWSDVLQLTAKVDALSNDLSNVNWDALQAMATDIRRVTNSLVDNVTWSSIQTIGTDVQDIQTLLQGVDFQQLDSIQTLLSLTSSSNVLTQIEQRLGTVTDSGTANTFFGRMTGLAQQLSSVGSSAAGAQQKAQSARTAAGGAAAGIQQVKKALEEGRIDAVMSVLEKLRSDLDVTSSNVSQLSEQIGPEGLNKTLVRMDGVMKTFAESKGFSWLTKAEEFPTGAGGAATGEGGVDPKVIGTLNRNMEDVRASMEFMQKLLDEMRYEPVVQDTLLGVE